MARGRVRVEGPVVVDGAVGVAAVDVDYGAGGLALGSGEDAEVVAEGGDDVGLGGEAADRGVGEELLDPLADEGVGVGRGGVVGAVRGEAADEEDGEALLGVREEARDGVGGEVGGIVDDEGGEGRAVFCQDAVAYDGIVLFFAISHSLLQVFKAWSGEKEEEQRKKKTERK